MSGTSTSEDKECKLTEKESESRLALKAAFRTIIEACGEDPEREGVLKSPLRAAKAFEFFTAGYKTDLKGKLNSISPENCHYNPQIQLIS